MLSGFKFTSLEEMQAPIAELHGFGVREWLRS